MLMGKYAGFADGSRFILVLYDIYCIIMDVIDMYGYVSYTCMYTDSKECCREVWETVEIGGTGRGQEVRYEWEGETDRNCWTRDSEKHLLREREREDWEKRTGRQECYHFLKREASSPREMRRPAEGDRGGEDGRESEGGRNKKEGKWEREKRDREVKILGEVKELRTGVGDKRKQLEWNRKADKIKASGQHSLRQPVVGVN